ncbi:MAG: DEAD/DEAH box helicase [Firmicutes bacterium]|nr:DEAD/DEAH box helicase [Bacillota bacterium]
MKLPLKTFPVPVPILVGGPGLAAGAALPEESFLPPVPAGEAELRGSETALVELARRMEAREWSEWDWHQLALTALRLMVRPGIDRLLVEDHCRERWRQKGVIPYPYQLATCRRVIAEMGGRAILADEVGMGKTVEAGMILKEYMLRGLVRRALILTPASLVWQWYAELRDKFGLGAAMQRSEHDWERCPVLVASLDTAKRPPHRDLVHGLTYDMLIVDEAHKLKNDHTENWRFVSAIRRRYCLLLTATPVQNDLRELYNLVTLIRPGQLGTYRQFQSRFMLDKRTPRNAAELRAALRSCIIRNKRGPGTIEFPPRRVRGVPVELSPAERRFYDTLTAFLREEYHRSGGLDGVLPLITLQREACSSVFAAMQTLRTLRSRASRPGLKKRLAELWELGMAAGPTLAKTERLLEVIGESDEQFIVFTEFRATQQYIRARLLQAGIDTLGFDGSMSPSKKEWTRQMFHHGVRVLVSTESGGEGLNFQFCRNVVNYDLPWNPMRLEQRIGRVHRLGQTRPVSIINLATRDTIEEYILYLLHEKLNMFHSVLGDVEAVLARLRMRRSFEQAIADIVLDSADSQDVIRRLDDLGARVERARTETRESELLDKILW